MAKIDHAAIRTSSYEDAQKFFEDVFDMHMWRAVSYTHLTLPTTPYV